VQRLSAARPDYVVDTVADLPAVLNAIEQRLRSGDQPPPV
jgi:hypothetical protein